MEKFGARRLHSGGNGVHPQGRIGQEPIPHGGGRLRNQGTGIPVPARIDSDLIERFRSKMQAGAHEPQAVVSPERFSREPLGTYDTELPIVEYKQQIVDAVRKHQITIVTAETGSGKSTQIPQYLLEAGFNITHTQPRILAAEMLAERIAEELTGPLGIIAASELVGVHTSDRNTTTELSKIRVVTDGLRVAQELGAKPPLEDEVLIVDEVHEWNTNMEIEIAWIKRAMRTNPKLRVVITSATMEAQALAKFFSDDPEAVPVIEVPGRSHEVTKTTEPESNVVDQIMQHVNDGSDILVFLPGVREIQDTIDAVEKKCHQHGITNVTLLPLHAKLSRKEQEAVRKPTPGIKIVCATNVAQTSVTLPDVDVVIDCGLERRVEIDEEGDESLNRRPVSRADLIQRAGRTGRVRPGQYILTRLNEDTPFIPADSPDRLDYPVPEVFRTNADHTTLQFAGAGLDVRDVEMFHQIDKAVLERSRRALQMIGALDEQGKITPRGLRMNSFPLRPQYARMIVEAEERDFSPRVRGYVSAMVAAMEVGGMPSYLHTAGRDWKKLTDEQLSDHLAQLDLFLSVQDADAWPAYRLAEYDLDVRNVERARKLYKKLLRRGGVADYTLLSPQKDEREQLIECVVAGMVDNVYQHRGGGEYARLIGNTAVTTLRELSNRSVIATKPSLVAATPYGYEHPKNGDQLILQEATAFQPAVLGSVAARLCAWENVDTTWRDGVLKVLQEQVFRGKIPTGLQREADAALTPETIDIATAFFLSHSGPSLNKLKQTKKQLEELQRRSANTLEATARKVMTHQAIEQLVREAIGATGLDAKRVDDQLRHIIQEQKLNLDDLVSPTQQAAIMVAAPDYLEVDGWTVQLRYSNGTPIYGLKSKDEIDAIPDDWRLPDGRPVRVRYSHRTESVMVTRARIAEERLVTRKV